MTDQDVHSNLYSFFLKVLFNTLYLPIDIWDTSYTTFLSPLQSTAPLYNLDNLYNSVALFWGDMDWLADPKDVEGLIPKIKNLVVNKQIQAWDHFDFIWGMDAPTVCYQDIIKIIRQKENWD